MPRTNQKVKVIQNGPRVLGGPFKGGCRDELGLGFMRSTNYPDVVL